MSSFDKYLEKLLQRPFRTDIGFDETKTFLTNLKIGYVAKDNGSSHCCFRKEGYPTLTIKRDTLKMYNIKQILEALQEIGIIGGNDDE